MTDLMRRFKENIQLGEIEVWSFTENKPVKVLIKCIGEESFTLELLYGGHTEINFNDE